MKSVVLGKIILLLMVPVFLWADVQVEVDKNALYKGDSVTYTISVTGSDIEFPEIDEIDGNPIESTGSSSNIRIINGNYEKTLSKSFTFTPQKSLEIPSYKVLVNGGVEETKPLKVKIVKPSQDKSAPVILDMKLSKTEVHVGEMVRFDLIFKKKPNVPVYKLDIEEPKFDNFWVKKIEGVKEGVEGEYTTQTHSYLLFAQKSGNFEIPAIAANVGQLSRQSRRGIDPFFSSAFGQQVRYTKIFSNALKLNVAPLPNGLELYGKFKIDAHVDKHSVGVNKPLNLTIKVKGIGNIDDVQKFDLEIPGAVIYANEPVIKSGMSGEQYGGTFEQKIVIIADHSYTIEPLKLHYYDKDQQKEVVVETKPIDIDVRGAVAPAPQIESLHGGKVTVAKQDHSAPKTVRVVEQNTSALIFAALIGFVTGLLFMWLWLKTRIERQPKIPTMTPIEKRIKNVKDDKALFELLLAYKQEGGLIAEVLGKLEENLYRGAHHSIDKKRLMAYFRGEEREVELP